MALVDGREELVDEVRRADDNVRNFLATEVDKLLGHPRFIDGVFAALRPDTSSQARAEAIVIPRPQSIADTR